MFDDIRKLFSNALEYESKGKFKESIDLYNTIINKLSSIIKSESNIQYDILKIAAETHLRLFTLGHTKDADLATEGISLYKTYLQKVSNDNEARLDLVCLLELTYDYKESRKQIEEVLKSNPNNIQALEHLSDLVYYYNNLGTVEECITYKQKLIELQPNRLKHYYELAILWCQIDDYQKARESYFKILNLVKEDSKRKSEFETEYGSNFNELVIKALERISDK